MMKSDPDYVAETSFYVVVKDYEQESCFVLMLWCLAIIAYKGREAVEERRLLGQSLVPIAEGVRVLPEDTRDYARQLEALPDGQRGLLLPRLLHHALVR